MSVYIIAEAGVNHNGSMKIAEQLVEAAALAGCNAVKFQTFKADSIVTKDASKARYQTENTGTSESQYDMLKRLELGLEEHKKLIDICKNKNIEFISTPFDFESVDMLDSLGVALFKISSGDLTNKPLLKYIAKKGKPIILSTGMSYLNEVEKALSWIYETGNKKVTLLHCTTQYPTPIEEVNLNAMKTLKEIFKVPVGYSDHTEGIQIPIAAAALGAVVIEKHFTLDKNLPGPDHKASIEPYELTGMVGGIRCIEAAFGDGVKAPTIEERNILVSVRKSVVTTKPVKKGQVITNDCISVKRPATGIAPERMDDLIGKTFSRDLPADYVLRMEDVNGEV